MPYDDRGQAAVMRRSEWDRRVRRAADLAERFPDASQILTFYRHILQFQRSMYEEVSTHSALVDTADAGQFTRTKHLLLPCSKRCPRSVPLIPFVPS